MGRSTRGFVPLVIAICVGILVVIGAVIATRTLDAHQNAQSVSVVPTSTSTISETPIPAQTETSKNSSPQAIDPNIKIERCKTIESSELTDFIDKENAQFSSQTSATYQDLEQKRKDEITTALLPLFQSQSQNSAITSANSELEYISAQADSITQTMSVETQLINQKYQEKYNQDYIALKSRYQAELDAYAQSLSAEYIKCLDSSK